MENTKLDVNRKIPIRVYCLLVSMLLSTFSFEYAVFVSFMQTKLSLTQVGVLFAINSISVLVFEYLTGIFADRKGYKLTLLLGGIVFIIAQLIFLLSGSYVLLMLAMIFVAISIAAKSGADVALLHNILDDADLSSKFEEILCNLMSAVTVSEVLVLLLGAWISAYGFQWPFVLTIIASTISIAILLFVPEQRHNAPLSTKELIWSSLKLLATSKALLVSLVICVFGYPLYHVLTDFLQPYLTDTLGLHAKYNGVFYVAISLSMALGTKLTKRISKRIDILTCCYCSVGIISMAFITLIWPNILSAFASLAIIGFCFGVLYASVALLVNRIATDQNRATLISQQHAITKITQSVYLVVFGLLIEGMGLEHAFFIVGAFSLCVMAILAMFVRKKQNFVH